MVSDDMDEAYDRGARGAPLAASGRRQSPFGSRGALRAGVGTALLAAAEGALDRRRAFGALEEEVLQLTSRLVVPGARVGGRRLRPDTSRFGPLVSRLEEGDANSRMARYSVGRSSAGELGSIWR